MICISCPSASSGIWVAFVLWIYISTAMKKWKWICSAEGPKVCCSPVPDGHTTSLCLSAQVENEGLDWMISKSPPVRRLLWFPGRPSWLMSNYMSSVTSVHTVR